MEAFCDELMESATVPERPKRRCAAAEIPKGSRAEKHTYTKLVVDDKVEAEAVAWAKEKRGCALTRKEKIEVVLLKDEIRNGERKERENAGKVWRKGATRFSSRVEHLIGRKKVFVKKAWNE